MLAAILVSTLMDPQGGGRAAAPPSTVEQPAEAPVWNVQVLAPVYQPDGAVAAESATLTSAINDVVFVYGRKSICDVAVAGAKEPRDAGFGWRVASHIVSQSPTEVVVSIDWRRVWDKGRKVNDGPASTVQLTLHPGDRIPLDHIPAMPSADACRAVGMGLEVRLSRATPAAPPRITGELPMGAAPSTGRPLAADMWLMHTLPSGKEQVLHQVVPLPAKGGPFNFGRVPITTAQGEVGVEIGGQFTRFEVPSGGEFLVISMTRVVTGGTAPAQGITGTTGAVIPMPGPGDVLSFETSPAPAARGAGARGGRGGAGNVPSIAAGGAAVGTVGGRVAQTQGGGAAAGAPLPRTAAAGGLVAAGQGGARGGGGRGGAVERLALPSAALATAMLEGHVFSIRLQLKPASAQ